MNKSIIIGLDHATKSGISVFINGEFHESKIFELSEGRTYAYRFLEFERGIKSFIDYYKPDVMCLEEPKHLLNAKVLRYLTGLYTIALKLCVEHNIIIEECNPKSVKKVLTGSGKAEKVTVCDYIVKNYGIAREMLEEKTYYKTQPDMVKTYSYDKSDATALVLYYLEKRKGA